MSRWKRLVSDEELTQAAKEDPNTTRLAKKFGYNNIGNISDKMRKLGILTETKIITIIRANPKKDDETIAKEANVYPEAVKRIREQVEKSKITDKRKLVSDEELAEKTGKNEDTIERTIQEIDKSNKTNKEPAEKASAKRKLDVPEHIRIEIKSKLMRYPAIGAIAKEYKVPKELVMQIQAEIEQEKYDKTHTEVHFKARRLELLSSIKIDRGRITETSANLIEYKVDLLMKEFSKYLTTQYDYALIVYACIIARKYQKATDIAEAQLGLEDCTIEGLEKKVKEIMLGQEKEKSREGLKNNSKGQRSIESEEATR